MPVPLIAVGVLCMVKVSGVMGTYSMKNYDANPGSAYDRHQSLPVCISLPPCLRCLLGKDPPQGGFELSAIPSLCKNFYHAV